jgi:hypothetical protein
MTFASSSPLTVRYLRRELAGNGGIPASKRRAGPTNGALRFLVQHANGFTSRLAMKSPLPHLDPCGRHRFLSFELRCIPGSRRPHCSREASAGRRMLVLCPQRRHSYATSYNELVDRKLDRRTGRRCCRHRASWRGRQSRGSSWHARNARLKLFNQRPEGSAGFRNRPLDRIASSSCVRSTPHICALTAEDILIEHSSNAAGADCHGRFTLLLLSGQIYMGA